MLIIFLCWNKNIILAFLLLLLLAVKDNDRHHHVNAAVLDDFDTDTEKHQHQQQEEEEEDRSFFHEPHLLNRQPFHNPRRLLNKSSNRQQQDHKDDKLKTSNNKKDDELDSGRRNVRYHQKAINKQSRSYQRRRRRLGLTLKEKAEPEQQQDNDNDNDNDEPKQVQALIVGGQPVTSSSGRAAYDWFAAGHPGTCGASLVTRDILLSAAHCWPNQFQQGASIGAYHYNIATKEYNAGSVKRSIVDVRIHPQFSFPQNDIMVLKLNESVVGVNPVPLNTNSQIPEDGDSLVIVGFGYTAAPPNGSLSNVLQEAQVFAVNYKDCRDAWKDRNVDVDDTIMICATAPGTDTCDGDSGGPLLDRNTGTLVGITSFGPVHCGHVDSEPPAGYTRVSGFVSWLQETICELSDDPYPFEC